MADTCTGDTVACWISSQVNILSNVANNLIPVEEMLTGGAYIIGCVFLFKAIYSLKAYGEARTMMSSHTNIKEPIVHLLVGTLLIYFPSTFSAMMQTTFGSENVLQYGPINGSNPALNSLFGSVASGDNPIVMIIRVIGLVAFIRGWMLINRSASQGQQPGGTGKGLIHVFGGLLAINIVGTIRMINNTLYGT